MTREEILSYLRMVKAELEDKFGVVSIGLFGSYVRGEADAESDIDIAIKMKSDKKTLHNFLAVKRRIEAELGKKVDLGIESTLKPLVKERVEKEIIYA